MLIDDMVNILPNNDGITIEFIKVGDRSLTIENVTSDTRNIILTTVGFAK